MYVNLFVSQQLNKRNYYQGNWLCIHMFLCQQIYFIFISSSNYWHFHFEGVIDSEQI